ncbi:hypothetical protein EYF80_036013 [Liparis tanakae]|uniref:Uncharacterized protein n=1 Tax=Liparis tanakae TaxID=230148 RepID=A0A4Z2GJW1_9TELE|nr:hypothetical protein EYF80_036013 [Liparis tanakae]
MNALQHHCLTAPYGRVPVALNVGRSELRAPTMLHAKFVQRAGVNVQPGASPTPRRPKTQRLLSEIVIHTF